MKILYRSQTDRKIAGIFGGLGEAYNIDPNVLRLAAVLVLLASGVAPVLVTYVVAWFLLPDGKPKTERSTSATTASAARSTTGGAKKKPA
jgi:phage shock protein C